MVIKGAGSGEMGESIQAKAAVKIHQRKPAHSADMGSSAGLDPAIGSVAKVEKEFGIPLFFDDREKSDFKEPVGKLKRQLIPMEVFFDGISLRGRRSNADETNDFFHGFGDKKVILLIEGVSERAMDIYRVLLQFTRINVMAKAVDFFAVVGCCRC